MLVGAHMSVAGGVPHAFRHGERVGCTALQIFVKNANRWQGKPIPPADIREFASERARTGIRAVIAHASYLINLASPDDTLWNRSMDALVDELERCESLELDGLVFHPGSHVGEGEDAGLRRVSRALKTVIRRTAGFRGRILLETTAGQGTNLGCRFEHLARIRNDLAAAERVGTCIDTCHVFAAGYDLRTADTVRETLDEFERICGFDTLGAVHLNDSLKPFDSRRDRHAHIGEGEIGRDGFSALLQDPRVRRVPILLETPKGDALKEDQRNLDLVRALAAGENPKRRPGLRTDEWRKGTLRGQRVLARDAKKQRAARSQAESASSSS